MRQMTRRDALMFTAGLGVAAVGTPGCGRASDRSSGSGENSRSSQSTTTPASQRRLAAIAALPEVAAVEVSAAAGEPAYLIRSGDSLRALSAICTHARCTVAWQATSRQFQCPCHRGTYDPQGKVISGPPPRPLDELPIVVENGIAYLKS